MDEQDIATWLGFTLMQFFRWGGWYLHQVHCLILYSHLNEWRNSQKVEISKPWKTTGSCVIYFQVLKIKVHCDVWLSLLFSNLIWFPESWIVQTHNIYMLADAALLRKFIWMARNAFKVVILSILKKPLKFPSYRPPLDTSRKNLQILPYWMVPPTLYISCKNSQ